MGRLVASVQHVALALGAPGVLLVALLDSSVLSLPEVADLLVVWLVVEHKARLLLYALSATVGSVIGCLVLYYLGRRGGEALVRARFSGTSVDKTLATVQRFGTVAVLIPAILPPPMPFKIFVLLAGASGIRPVQFTVAVVIGRGARYLVEGLLAIRYGDHALAFMNAEGRTVSLVVASILAVACLGYLAWTAIPAETGKG